MEEDGVAGMVARHSLQIIDGKKMAQVTDTMEEGMEVGVVEEKTDEVVVEEEDPFKRKIGLSLFRGMKG